MLVEQTMDKLVTMKLKGMAEALRRWMEQPKEKEMTPLDVVGLLADAEWSHREQRKLTGRLRNARFRQGNRSPRSPWLMAAITVRDEDASMGIALKWEA